MISLCKCILCVAVAGFTLMIGCPDAEAQALQVGYGPGYNGHQYYGNGWNGGYRQQPVYGYSNGYNRSGWTGSQYQNNYTYSRGVSYRGRRGRCQRVQVQYGCVAYQQPVAACQSTGYASAGCTTQLTACCAPQPACCTTTAAGVVPAFSNQASEPTVAPLPLEESQAVRIDDDQVIDR